jgi:gas vesicle protein
MNKAASLVGAAAIGAGLMYLFDPDRGKRRRAKVRDKAIHLKRIAADAVGKTQRDVRNRIVGVIAETEALFRSEKVSDKVLADRVRSKLGRIVSHPHAVQVTVTDGVVVLGGPILAHEAPALCEAVNSMDGVKNIENLLELHESAENIPALQNGRRRFRQHFGRSDNSPCHAAK